MGCHKQAIWTNNFQRTDRTIDQPRRAVWYGQNRNLSISLSKSIASCKNRRDSSYKATGQWTQETFQNPCSTWLTAESPDYQQGRPLLHNLFDSFEKNMWVVWESILTQIILKFAQRTFSMTENGLIDVGKCVGSCRKDIAESYRVSFSFAT